MRLPAGDGCVFLRGETAVDVERVLDRLDRSWPSSSTWSGVVWFQTALFGVPFRRRRGRRRVAAGSMHADLAVLHN